MRWIDAACLQISHPRTDFRSAFMALGRERVRFFEMAAPFCLDLDEVAIRIFVLKVHLQ